MVGSVKVSIIRFLFCIGNVLAVTLSYVFLCKTFVYCVLSPNSFKVLFFRFFKILLAFSGFRFLTSFVLTYVISDFLGGFSTSFISSFRCSSTLFKYALSSSVLFFACLSLTSFLFLLLRHLFVVTLFVVLLFLHL